MFEKYAQNWGVLIDKFYQGAKEVVRVLNPKEKLIHGQPTMDEEEEN